MKLVRIIIISIIFYSSFIAERNFFDKINVRCIMVSGEAYKMNERRDKSSLNGEIMTIDNERSSSTEIQASAYKMTCRSVRTNMFHIENASDFHCLFRMQ